MARADEVRLLREKVDYLEKELERERTCHAACGTVSLANTRDSLKRAMESMHVDYKSPAVTDVAQAVRREIEYRERAEKAEALLAAAEIAPVSTVEGVRQWREGVRALREKAGCMQNDLNTAASTIASLQEQLRQRTAERDALNAKLDPLGPGMGKGEVASIELLKRENHSLRARLTVMEANCPPRRLTLSRDAAPGNEPSETAGMPVPGPVDLGGLLNQIADAIAEARIQAAANQKAEARKAA